MGGRAHKRSLGRGLATLLALAPLFFLVPAARVEAEASAAGGQSLAAPIWVYNNWSAYDELSDSVPLTEELAMRELQEMLRLRKLGVRLDYYLMDAFWYAPDGGYRTWRKESWPEGPERWIADCEANGIKPGLWFSTNTLSAMAAAPQWRSSLTANGEAMSLYAGGFLADFMDVLQYWYDRGIRVFKFDFADFAVAVKGDEKTLTRAEIRARNVAAFRQALLAFRGRNPDAVLVAFNGFGGDMISTAAPLPFQDPVDARWLDIFDTLYSGDPRASDVPEMDFWRSMDIYSDHMVRRFEASGIPLRRIDSTGFMIGNTGTNYFRGTNAWQGMLLLMIARGGWVNMVYGNLEFLDAENARWFAKVQRLYEPLQKAGITTTFGGVPGDVEPYGFASEDADGALFAVVNPSQSVKSVRLPLHSPEENANAGERILFRDAGFSPVLAGNSVELGPGQLALVAFGRYANPANDLGVQSDIRIPRSIEPLAMQLTSNEDGSVIESVIAPPPTGDLRVVMQQRDVEGAIMRSVSNVGMGDVFLISASQDGMPLPVEIRYDKVIWSGLSWAVGEIRHKDIALGQPIRLRISTTDAASPLILEGHIYRVQY